MKIKLVICMALCCIILASLSVADGLRFQIATCSFIKVGDVEARPIINFRTGVSTKMATVGTSGALYGVVLGRYGESGDMAGAGVELAFFPVAPGRGLSVFFPLGTQVSQIDLGDDPITYWQATSGVGLYWDFSERVAVWGAVRAETSEDYTTVDAGLGLSISVL